MSKSIYCHTIIYLVRNLINQKVYIGVTSRPLGIRKKEHLKNSKYGSDYYFHQALRKYSPTNFEWVVIDHTFNQRYAFNILEPHYIAKFDSFKHGYNMTPGGGKFEHSDETKEKISQTLRQIEIHPSLLKNLHHTQNMTVGQISKFLGITQSVISKRLKKYGLSKPRRNSVSLITLIDNYQRRRMTHRQLAMYFQVSQTTIFRLLKKYNISR